MPTLSSKHSNDPLKLLIMGEPGSGKTGALASLALAGYELFILDFDNGTDILEYVLRNKPEAERVHVETLTDKANLQGTTIRISSPTAFPRALGFCNKWVDSESKHDFGSPATWDNKRILVLDSLTMAGQSALNFCLAKNNRAGEQPWQSDWGEAMRMLEQFLSILYSSSITCHVIVLTHIQTLQQEGSNVVKGLPMALGQQLPPKVGRYFNTMLLAKSKGVGDSAKRVLYTKPEGIIEVKCPILDAPRELPVESGLATLFQMWTKGSAASVSTVQPMTPAKASA